MKSLLINFLLLTSSVLYAYDSPFNCEIDGENQSGKVEVHERIIDNVDTSVILYKNSWKHFEVEASYIVGNSFVSIGIQDNKSNNQMNTSMALRPINTFFSPGHYKGEFVISETTNFANIFALSCNYN